MALGAHLSRIPSLYFFSIMRRKTLSYSNPYTPAMLPTGRYFGSKQSVKDSHISIYENIMNVAEFLGQKKFGQELSTLPGKRKSERRNLS
jgi:hypothetical protein